MNFSVFLNAILYHLMSVSCSLLFIDALLWICYLCDNLAVYRVKVAVWDPDLALLVNCACMAFIIRLWFYTFGKSLSSITGNCFTPKTWYTVHVCIQLHLTLVFINVIKVELF